MHDDALDDLATLLANRDRAPQKIDALAIELCERRGLARPWWVGHYPMHSGIAQLAEQTAVNRWVPRSNRGPGVLTP